MHKGLGSVVLLLACTVSGALVPQRLRAQVEVAVAGDRSASARPVDDLVDLRSQLRHLVQGEERYFRAHGTYTTDLAALHLLDSRPEARSWLQVIYAGGRSWSGRAIRSGPPPRSCVIFVGDLKDSPQAPLTEANHLAPVVEGDPRCDGDVTR